MGIQVAPGVELPDQDPEVVWVVGALIADGAGRIFVQRRAPDRRLFPDRWDIVGGHVDPGEDLLTALERELAEETGWRLRRVEGLVAVVDWETPEGEPRREVDLLVTVEGDLAAPDLEWDKHSTFRWLEPAQLHLLDEHRDPADTLIRDVVAAGFDLLR